MGCGGSKDAVATGNTTASGAAGKLLRRKSSVSTGPSHTSFGSAGVAVKDVVKEPAAGEADNAAGVVEAASAGSPTRRKGMTTP
ncbi:uncharacterized protein LOC120664124 [Panicum virgatum]|uniref:uncharacterized protein LOC120664124 n=1 Tax=Panicum virgatum TaxID=38727 RepID=UPI0019D6708F|nr:uncharacterized protein LOC120664124 [Panicum virgatum]